MAMIFAAVLGLVAMTAGGLTTLNGIQLGLLQGNGFGGLTIHSSNLTSVLVKHFHIEAEPKN